MTVRVVSLVPSVTETLLAWGVQPVAVTRFCEHPELPAVGGTKDPDVERIAGLEPDLVVVCVEENRREDADALAARGVPLHVISIDSVGDVAPALDELRGAVGVAAPPLVLPDLPEQRPRLRAFIPIWRRPWMTMSGQCYGSSLLAQLGVDNIFAAAGERYPATDLDAAAFLAPDVVLAPSEPYPFSGRHVAELERVAPVVLIDGRDLFWWGVRTPTALDRLHAQLSGICPRVPSAAPPE